MMKTSRDRLEWLIDFSQTDTRRAEQFPELAVRELKEWERLKLESEVLEFIGFGDDEQFQFALKSSSEIEGERHFQELLRRTKDPNLSQQERRKALIALSTRTTDNLPANDQHVVTPAILRELQMSAYFSLSFISPGGGSLGFSDKSPHPLIALPPSGRMFADFTSVTVGFNSKSGFLISGSIEELFNGRMLLVLHELGVESIHNCPECQRIFCRNRKQVYCSKLCTDRVARREWLKKPKNRKKDAQWSHDRYRRRMEEKSGAKNLKIERRPRIKRTKGKPSAKPKK